MKNGSVISDKSLDFALRIIKAYKFLINEKQEYVLSKQILRSGTAIGALIRKGNLQKVKRISFTN